MPCVLNALGPEEDHNPQPEPGEHRYTVFFGWGRDSAGYEMIEEVDVNATSDLQARVLARVYAEEAFQPGWKIIRTIRRTGYYW